MRVFLFWIGAVFAGIGCTEDAELGRELRSFCALVEEAATAHPDDRAARSRYVAERSDAAMSSSKLVDVMRDLAVADAGERPEILAEAARRGGLRDFECPEILSLYQ